MQSIHSQVAGDTSSIEQGMKAHGSCAENTNEFKKMRKYAFLFSHYLELNNLVVIPAFIDLKSELTFIKF